MKKVSLILVVSLIISTVLAGCAAKTTNNTTNTANVATNKAQQTSKESTNQNAEVSPSANKSSTSKFEIITKTYVNKNVKMNYPQIINFSDVNKQNQINALIKNDILNKYKKDIANLLNGYYKTTKEAEDNLFEDVTYDIKLNNSNFLSILYVEEANITGSMHPSKYVHSININIQNGTILKLKDLININNNFVDKLKNATNRVWTPKTLPGVTSAELNKQLVGIVSDRLSTSQNKDLINEFNSEDYSFYFTEDYFGITIDIAHATGDYAELEIKYNDIKDNIKSENGIWKNFIKEDNTTKQESKKKVYKTKLDNIVISLKSLDKKDAGTTQDMREAADERYKSWDTALNEIYSQLKAQLPSSDMKKLQSEEIQWISKRDTTAKEAAAKMKGGTMEPVLYRASLADTTKKRCYELVEKYMQ